MIIAIDGPAGSGKSTIARLLAERLGMTFLNSGKFYRAAALALLRADVDRSNERLVLETVRSLAFDYRGGRMFLDGRDVERELHTDAIDALSSEISAIVPVRHCVNEHLRRYAAGTNVVCEGRDMTTVVFPNAEYKFYLDASPRARAERRFKQGVSSLSFDEILDAINKRDEMDKNKKEGSLKLAPDALYFDTSDLTIEQVCGTLISKITI